MRLPRLLLVTDPAYEDDALEQVARAASAALSPGTFGVQLRDKTRTVEAVGALARRLRAVTAEHGHLFVVNRDLDLAREVGADGVHLGHDALPLAEARRRWPEAWISVAAHSDDDVKRARADGADAVLTSPIFATPRKASPRGVAAIVAARFLAGPKLGVYALGGVDLVNARACAEAGADGVAVIRALLGSPAPARAAEGLVAPFLPKDS